MRYENGILTGRELLEWMRPLNHPRAAGSAEENEAAEYIASSIGKSGAEVCREYFSFEKSCVTEASLYAAGNTGKSLRVTGYSIGDGGKERRGTDGIKGNGNAAEEFISRAEGSLLYAEDGGDFALSKAEDKIVLLNNRVDRSMYEKLVKAGANGFLTVTGTPIDTGSDCIPARYRLHSIEGKRIPGASVHYRDAMRLIEEANLSLRLEIRQQIRRMHSSNIIAKIKGTGRGKDYILLSAHYDSVPEGPGAYDNLAACAVLTALLKYFSKHPVSCELRFVWLGGEEEGLTGSRAYAARHAGEAERCILNLNMDLAGQAVGSDVIGVTADESLCRDIGKILEKGERDCSIQNKIWSGDANSFAWKGIPALTYDRDGFGMHTAHDELSLISPWELEREISLMILLTEELSAMAESKASWTVPQDMRDKLDEDMRNMEYQKISCI